MTITRHGIPIAVVLRPDALRARRAARAFAHADEIGRGIEEGRRRPLDIRGLGLAQVFGVGSVVLIPEVLTKPDRQGDRERLALFLQLLGRLELRPTTVATARLAADLGATYHLRAADAVHLATAVEAGADRFITTNTRDFPKTIEEIDITYPEDLPDP